MAYFYFTRTRATLPFSGRHLVSGVVEAETVEEARSKLDHGLTNGGTVTARSSSSDFSFVDLAGVERTGAGLLAITIQDE